jgi:2-furoyl-CoA dehydrogenase FAD binding subunit
VRLGVGGLSGRPAVQRLARDGAARDAVEKLATDLEGYEDLHASAALRRDILRRLGPVVVEEALRCAA